MYQRGITARKVTSATCAKIATVNLQKTNGLYTWITKKRKEATMKKKKVNKFSMSNCTPLAVSRLFTDRKTRSIGLWKCPRGKYYLRADYSTITYDCECDRASNTEIIRVPRKFASVIYHTLPVRLGWE